jgi:hypothetical protein
MQLPRSPRQTEQAQVLATALVAQATVAPVAMMIHGPHPALGVHQSVLTTSRRSKPNIR